MEVFVGKKERRKLWNYIAILNNNNNNQIKNTTVTDSQRPFLKIAC